MSPLVKDLLVKGLMAGTAVKQAKKTSATVAFYGIAGCFGFLACVYFSIAGYGFLQESYSAPIAAAMTGCVILAIAGSIALYGWNVINKKKIARKANHDGGFVDMVENTLKGFVDNFEEPIRDNPKAALLMAALAGFAAGDKLGEKTH